MMKKIGEFTLRFFSSLLTFCLTLSFMTVFAGLTSFAADFANTDTFVSGEEYLLVMSGTKMYVNGTYVAGNREYCVVGETYSTDGMALDYAPTTSDAAQACLWRISYATNTRTVTLYSDYAGKYLNLSSRGPSLSDTPQALNANIAGTTSKTIQLYVTESGTNYYLRLTRGTSTVYGRWLVGTASSSSAFTLRPIQEDDADTFVRPMRQFVSGEQYVLSRSSVTDKAGVTGDFCVVAGEKENALQYAPRPTTLKKATDTLWTITKNGDGTYVFYSAAAEKYLNLSGSAAFLSDTPQNLNATLSGRTMTVYTVVDATNYYLRFTNALTTGSGWHSGTSTSSHQFTLYTLQQQEKEYDNAGQTPLYSVACFADLHIDYGIQSWETPIRQSTVDAVNYLKETLGGANVVLVGGDIVSNNDKYYGKAEWTNENLRNTMDTVYSTMLEASTDGIVLPITGNHDSDVGNAITDATVYAEDWDPYLLENVGVFDAYMRNPDSKLNELLCYRYSLNGMEFINLNTPYRASGFDSALYESQVDWLEDQLGTIGADKTVILQCHYQLAGYPPALAQMRTLLEDYPNVIYCYGHLHENDSRYAWYATSELVRPISGSETQNPDNSWNVSAALSCHMGSMGYYGNQYQSGRLTGDERLVVQFLKIDFYADHITFRYYNTGTKSGDPDVYEITSFTVARDMTDQLSALITGFDFAADTPKAKTVDAAPFTVSASGRSNETVTYAVASGPATIDAQTGLVTLSGTQGTVILRATSSVDGEADVTATHVLTVTASDATQDTGIIAGAEDAVLGGTGASKGTYNGVNYVNYGNDKNGQSATYTVTIPQAGKYYVGILYNIGSNTTRYLRLSVNGQAVNDIKFVRNSSAWGNLAGSRWSYQMVSVDLAAGENTLNLAQYDSNAAPMISDLALWSADEWQTALDNPTLSGSSRIHSYSGFEKIGYDTASSGTVSWTVTAPKTGLYSISAAYSTATDADIDLLVNSVAAADLTGTASATGVGNAWGIATAENVILFAGDNVISLQSDDAIHLGAIRLEQVDLTEKFPVQITRDTSTVTGDGVQGDQVTREGETVSKFEIAGAQIRYNRTTEKADLRFVARISRSLMTELTDLFGEENVEYGILLQLTNALGNGELTEANINGKTIAAGGAVAVPGAKTFKTYSNYFYYTAVITGMPDSYYDKEVTARAYIKVGDTYYYASEPDGITYESGASEVGGGYSTSWKNVAGTIARTTSLTDNLSNSIRELYYTIYPQEQ